MKTPENLMIFYRNISLFVILLMPVLFSGCGPEKLDGFKTYKNDTHDLFINYPADWSIHPQNFSDTENAVGPIVVFQPASKDSLDTHITLFTELLPDSIKNVDEYFNYSKEMLHTRTLQIDITDEGKDIINGIETHWVEFDFRRMKQESKSLTYMLFINGKGYNISSVANSDSYAGLKPIFEKVSRSIKFD